MILILLKKLKELGEPKEFRKKENLKQINFEVGSNLKKEILLKGIKVQDAAVSLDMTPANLEKIFSGKVKMDVPKLFALLVLHGINPLNVLFGRSWFAYLSEFMGENISRLMIMDYVTSALDDILIEVNKQDENFRTNLYSVMFVKILDAQNEVKKRE